VRGKGQESAEKESGGARTRGIPTHTHRHGHIRGRTVHIDTRKRLCTCLYVPHTDTHRHAKHTDTHTDASTHIHTNAHTHTPAGERRCAGPTCRPYTVRCARVRAGAPHACVRACVCVCAYVRAYVRATSVRAHVCMFPPSLSLSPCFPLYRFHAIQR
jgi:hypothetical protein